MTTNTFSQQTTHQILPQPWSSWFSPQCLQRSHPPPYSLSLLFTLNPHLCVFIMNRGENRGISLEVSLIHETNLSSARSRGPAAYHCRLISPYILYSTPGQMDVEKEERGLSELKELRPETRRQPSWWRAGGRWRRARNEQQNEALDHGGTYTPAGSA